MDDRARLKAAYDYLIYGNLIHNDEYFYHPNLNEYIMLYLIFEDSVVNSEATLLLALEEGVCDHFASLYTVMALRMGYPAEKENGRYINRDGSKHGHAWSKVEVNGVDYYFDPDIEASLYHRGYNPSYYLFYQTKSAFTSTHEWADPSEIINTRVINSTWE